MKIICMICSEEVDETLYPEHMATVHKGKSQLEAMAEEKSRKIDIPKMIPLDKDSPVPTEMQEVLQAIDKGPVEVPTQSPQPTPATPKPNVNQGAGVPLKLKYVWEGNCAQDQTPVRTVITKVDGRWFISAYCLTHGELSQQEVNPLEKEVKNVGSANISKTPTAQTEVRSVSKSNGKRISSKS